MADRPDFIVASRDRDLRGRRNEVWVRRGVLGLFGVVSLLGLVNIFGQKATTSTATAQPATLEVDAPARLRSGLLYSARFTVHATQTLDDAALVFDSKWVEGMQVNTIEPSPVSETSQNGSLHLELGTIEAGQQYKLFLSFQVNPTTVGHRDQSVQLVDGDQPILTLHRTLTIYP
jgi:hypothetical protein